MADEPLSWMARLKRHHIFRVASVYAIAAWVLMQLADSIFPDLGLPRQSVLILIVAVALLFPVVLVLSWMFIPPSRENPAKFSRWQHLRWRLGSVLTVMVVALVTLSGVYLWHTHTRHLIAEAMVAIKAPLVMSAPSSASNIPAKSIAVLPFENLSPDPDNAYFAAGMQDVILTKLTEISGLKVIARTSTEKYASHPDDLKSIAQLLDVATFLEGSVQKSGNQVLINVQLIDANNNSHLWAEMYERKLNNVFDVENEVAKRIAAALQATLTITQLQRLTAAPTSVAAAYDAYLRGLANQAAHQGDAAALQQAADDYRSAVQLDPGFSLAWAKLATIESEIYSSYDHTHQRLQLAKQAANKASLLDPDSGEIQLSLGDYYYIGLSNYDLARTAYERAIELLPNSAVALADLSDLERSQGQWALALVHQQQSLALDPLNVQTLVDITFTYTALGRFVDAMKLINRALEIDPGLPGLLVTKAVIYHAEGDMQHADETLTGIRIPLSTPSDFLVALQHQFYKRDYAMVVGLLQPMLSQPQHGLYLQQGIFSQQLGFSEQLAGNLPAAALAYAHARDALRARLKADPNNPIIFAWLGLTEAGLGHKKAALAASQRAITLVPASSDAVYGPGYEELQARIMTQVGEHDQAIAELSHLLSIPYSSNFYGCRMTAALLRLDPVWDPIRNDPRFQALLKKYETSSDTPAP